MNSEMLWREAQPGVAWQPHWPDPAAPEEKWTTYLARGTLMTWPPSQRPVFYLFLQHPKFLKGSKCLCNEKQAFPTLGAEVNGCRVPADREKQSIFHYPAKATGCLGCQQFLGNKDKPYTQSPHLKRRSLYKHLLGWKEPGEGRRRRFNLTSEL